MNPELSILGNSVSKALSTKHLQISDVDGAFAQKYIVFLSFKELCYGEEILGLDACLSGQYIKPAMPFAPVFPFCGPTKLNVSIKPGENPTQKIQFTVKQYLFVNKIRAQRSLRHITLS